MVSQQYALISKLTLQAIHIWIQVPYYFAHRNTGVVAVGVGIYAIFSSMSAAAITALLASPGTMALGILGIFGLGASVGKLWHKGWSKFFSWFKR